MKKFAFRLLSLMALVSPTMAFAQTGTTAWVGNTKSDTLSIIKVLDNTIPFPDVGAGCANCQPGGICSNPPPPPCINGPHDMAFNLLGDRAFVTNYDDGKVVVLDTTPLLSGNAPVRVGGGPGGERPQGIVVHPNGTRVYVASSGDDAVTVLDLSGNNLYWAGTIVVGNDPNGVVITPDGSKVYVTCNIANRVFVVDTATNTVLTPNGITVGASPRRILIGDPPSSSVGLRVYVASADANTVSVIDADPNDSNPGVDVVVATVAVGTAPRGMAFAPLLNFVYVTNHDSFTMTKIDTSNDTVAGTIPLTTGVNPYRIAITSDGMKAYVTNPKVLPNGTVSVHQVSDGFLLNTITVMKGPGDIDILP